MSDDFYDGFDKPLKVRAAPNGFISYEAYTKQASRVVELERKLAESRLDTECLHAKISMIVARLGGIVEGRPTGVHNLLQRIDMLIREEILHAEHHKRGGTCRKLEAKL